MKMMSGKVHLCLLVALVQVFGLTAFTDTNDFVALKSLKDVWSNTPPSWRGDDPCGKWEGISCNNSRVISITLASNNLRGQLTSDITGLTELQTLDLSYNKYMTGPLPSQIENLKNLRSLILVACGFSGELPPSLGSLEQLVYLSLNLNSFIGKIPPELGKLSNLKWLDLADNKFEGPIPVSPGLDSLVHTKHFHLGKNKLSGDIPPKLFSSDMSLIHLLLDNNELTGSIPSSLGLMQKLEVVRLDRNSLGGPVPGNLNNLTSVQDLHLANNQLTGPVPNLTGMDALNYVDMSNNSFDLTVVPLWFSSLLSLTSLIMQKTNILGELPSSVFSKSQLQTVDLKDNQINGTLDIGSSHSDNLHLIDLRNNRIDSFTERPGFRGQIILLGNPACEEQGQDMKYCILDQTSDSYSTPIDCEQPSCRSRKISSPNCECAHPYSGILYFRAPSFSTYGNKSLFKSLEEELINSFSNHGQPVDSVFLSNPTKNSDGNLGLNLQLFPSHLDHFNRTGISGIGFILSNQTFKPPKGFGPFYFKADDYPFFGESNKSLNTNLIIGAAVGGCILVLLLIIAGVYGFRQNRRAETAKKKNNPFASWDPNGNSGGVPQLTGAKSFSFQELKKCTNNFSDDIGCGGYGKVYKGNLPTGQLVAVKRAQQSSMQGGLEFKTEIELLSRVHHKNVVGLVGFCFEQAEQMLIYEYIPNGTLKECLAGKSGIRLDWLRRLRIALGAARGLQYLHDLANPPIIHRDIKSNNILLDERLNAKVADFGLSKPVGDQEKGHVTTQVKGTMGYLDPEYYMSQQLTEKSDVYGFGVLLLELLTARNPIVKGKYIVREVKEARNPSKDLYGLEELLDPIVANNTAPGTVERMVDLALRCVEECGINRPPMSEVVKEIESIMVFAGLNPNAESASTSNSYEGAGKDIHHPYSNESLFSRSGSHPANEKA